MAAKKTGKKAKKTAQAKRTKPSAKGAQSMTLRKFLDSVHEHAMAKEEAGTPTGACLLTDPQSGQSTCVLTDQASCKALGGKFIGGPC